MKRYLLLLSMASILLNACDIRSGGNKKNSNNNQTSQNNNKKKPITDSTTVRLIDTTYNFGTVNDGEAVTYNFRFINTGKKPLVIDEANASCGCTVPEKPEQPIAPGDTGFIKVKFNSTARPGDVSKTIYVSSNARPEFPTMHLKGWVNSADSTNSNKQ